MAGLESKLKQAIGFVLGKAMEQAPGITKIALDQVLEDNVEMYGEMTRPVYDEQTGLLSKSYFEKELLSKRLSEAEQKGIPVSYALMDIDNLKAINDLKGGHGAGDAAIDYLSDLIKTSFRTKQRRKRGFSFRNLLYNKRKSDRRENAIYNDMVTGESGRVGMGDEFGVVLYGCNERQAVKVMNRFLENLRSKNAQYGQNEIFVTASIGVAQYEPGLSPKDLIKRADTAMYNAKEAGRNTVKSHITNPK